MIRVGTCLDDRFMVLAQAGAGGMGTVYRARDLSSNIDVALKTLRLDATVDAATDRFAHEVRVLVEVSHPGVVRYVAHGLGEEGAPYLVMEWIEGITLSARLREGEPATFGEVQALGASLASALAACHARGVVHRDLKPGNVMLRAGDIELPTVVDFGLARLSAGASLTVSGARLGTPRFMAPEQIRDARRVDGRADVFSLGCILFECATGKPAFTGDEAMGVMVKILLERAPRVRDACPTVPSALARWIDAALEPSPDARPQALELAEALAMLDLLDAGPQSAPLDSLGRVPSVVPSLGSDPQEPAIEEAHFESNLPRPSGTFVGRDAVLRDLDALLDGSRVTVALWGPPGIGKTRLALESLSRRRESAPIFCDLRELRTQNELTRVVGCALGLELGADPIEAERAVGRALAARSRTILLLDGVDHMMPELAAFRRVMQARAPALRLLLTSRERLDLEDVERLELGPLDRRDAATLFLDRARPALGDGADHAAVDEIVAFVSCIPLAVELAAGRIDVLGLDGLRARSQGAEQNDNLASVMRDAVGWSVSQLDDVTARGLSLAAIFPASFSLAAATAVIEADAEGVLARLRAKSLLGIEAPEPGGDVRLWMLAPIRAFVLAQSKAEQRRGALDRYAAFHADLAGQLSAELERSGSLTAQKRLIREERHLQLALEHLLSRDPLDHPAAVTLLAGLEAPLAARGATDQLVMLIERALARSDESAYRLHRLRARALAARGRAADARTVLHTVIEHARTNASPALGGLVLELGVLHHACGALSEARVCYEAAIEALAELGHERDEARALGNLGALLHDSGELDRAVSHYREAIALLRAVGDLRLHGIFLGNLALLEQERGARADARKHYEEAVAELEAYHDPRLLGVTLGNLAALDLEEGLVERARPRLERAQGLLALTGDARSQALCLARLGAALARLGNVDEADAKLTRAERLVARRDPNALRVVQLLRAFVDLARADAARDDPNLARRHRDAARLRCLAAEEAASGSDDLRTILRTLRPYVQGDTG